MQVTHGQGRFAPSTGAIVLPTPGRRPQQDVHCRCRHVPAWARVLIGSHLSVFSRASSLFDKPASRHLEVAGVVAERAKRRIESRYDVVILLESITRLGRVSSTAVLSGGKVFAGQCRTLALCTECKFERHQPADQPVVPCTVSAPHG
jgi:hypothetical protein